MCVSVCEYVCVPTHLIIEAFLCGVCRETESDIDFNDVENVAFAFSLTPPRQLMKLSKIEENHRSRGWPAMNYEWANPIRHPELPSCSSGHIIYTKLPEMDCITFKLSTNWLAPWPTVNERFVQAFSASIQHCSIENENMLIQHGNLLGFSISAKRQAPSLPGVWPECCCNYCAYKFNLRWQLPS